MTRLRPLSPGPDGFDPDVLRLALSLVGGAAWSLPSRFADTRVHHGYRRVELVSAGHRSRHAARFGWVLDGFAPVYAAWLSWIEPGGFILPHTDGGPWRERWQVPIAAAGSFRGDGSDYAPVDGVPFPVRHWEPHAVVNDTGQPRIHLVIDRDHVVDDRRVPFAVHPVPEQLEPLIERSLHGSHA